jgi:hypothetical protein
MPPAYKAVLPFSENHQPVLIHQPGLIHQSVLIHQPSLIHHFVQWID